MAKNQLHQLLAVESTLVSKAKTIIKEAMATFKSKSDHFDGHVRTYIPFAEVENELMEEAPQIKEIVTTVHDKLRYTAKSISKAIDAKVSKEQTNTATEATVMIGDSPYSLSATALLALEGFLLEIRDLYKGIPTLDPAIRWEPAADEHVYQAAPRDTFRTEKVADPVVLYPATPEHPAQTQMVTMDKNVGIVRVKSTSGRLTPKEKSVMLENIDTLIIRVRKARGAANRREVLNVSIGSVIFDFIEKAQSDEGALDE